VSEPGSVLLGRAELGRAFTALSAIASPAGVPSPALAVHFSRENLWSSSSVPFLK
jgi:hypothetical protein